MSMQNIETRPRDRAGEPLLASARPTRSGRPERVDRRREAEAILFLEAGRSGSLSRFGGKATRATRTQGCHAGPQMELRRERACAREALGARSSVSRSPIHCSNGRQNRTSFSCARSSRGSQGDRATPFPPRDEAPSWRQHRHRARRLPPRLGRRPWRTAPRGTAP